MRFTAPFDFSPVERGGRVTIAYREGMVRNVTRACADAAKAAGKAVAARNPRLESDDGATRRG